MYILNGFTGFRKTLAKNLLIEIKSDYAPINFEKLDLKRSKFTNQKILKLFDRFINSPGMDDILLWYKSQNSLLYIYIDTKTNKLKFYGCNKYVEHHSSNIEYIIKWVLHQILHDNGSKKTLVDRHSSALVGFGILPLFEKEESGNVYQGFNTKFTCNVKNFQVLLSDEQISLAREILRLIKST